MAQDVAGVFKSDEHRRVLGWVADSHAVRGWKDGPRRDTAEGLALALTREDEGFQGSVSEDEVNEILLDLEADGHVTLKNERVKRTAKGTKALQK